MRYIQKKRRESDRALREVGKFSGSFRRADELRDSRRIRRIVRDDYPLRSRLTAIPLSDADSDAAVDAARNRHPRRKNWDAPEADTESREVYVATIYHGQYSSLCKYEKKSYRPTLRSCGACTKRRLLRMHGHDWEVIQAPRGWQWGKDKHGLYLVKNTLADKDDRFRYHFCSSELDDVRRFLLVASRSHIEKTKRIMREERGRRKERRLLEQRCARAVSLGVWVSFGDSIAAGNCPGGTKTWCDKYRISPRKHYPIDVIRRMAMKMQDASAVDRAIDHAIRRSATELENGYCLVASHTKGG